MQFTHQQIRTEIGNAPFCSIDSSSNGATPRTLIWTKNKAKLFHYQSSTGENGERKATVLIIYALITKPYILDLLPERSFIGYLVEHGIDVYLLDWGNPGPEDREISIDMLVTDYIPRAVKQVLKNSQIGYLHLLGYCMGGVLTTLYIALNPDAPLESMVLLATPVDFSQGRLQLLFGNHLRQASRLIKGTNNISASYIGRGTKLLRIATIPDTLVDLWENAKDELYPIILALIVRWAEDNVAFPGRAYQQWIKDFYQENRLINGQLKLAEQPVYLSDIKLPLFHIAAEQDSLVTLSQILPMFEQIKSTEKVLMTIPGGHLGLVTNQKAKNIFWPRLVDWLASHTEH